MHCSKISCFVTCRAYFCSVRKLLHIVRFPAAGILLVAMLLQTFSHWVLVADYYANTAAYAKNCENKARPWLHCNGKCQLMKQLAAREKEQQEKQDGNFLVKSELAISTRSFYAIISDPVTTASKRIYYIPLVQGGVVDRTFRFFHPPRC